MTPERRPQTVFFVVALCVIVTDIVIVIAVVIVIVGSRTQGCLPVLAPRGAIVIVTGLRRTERHRGQWIASTMASLFEAPGAANGEPGQSCSCSPCCSDRGKGRSGQAGAPESRMDEYCNWSRERAACQIPTISVCNPCNYACKSWVLHLRKTWSRCGS